jgi:copper chaperone CopZ
MATSTYVVPGITCGHCKSAIEGEVAGLAGVDSVEVDITSKQVVVVGSASDAAVRAAIVEAGYEAASA